MLVYFSSSWERIVRWTEHPLFWNWYIGQCHTVVDIFSILQVAWIALSPSGQTTKSGKNFSGNMKSASWLPSVVFIEMKHILVCFYRQSFWARDNWHFLNHQKIPFLHRWHSVLRKLRESRFSLDHFQGFWNDLFLFCYETKYFKWSWP